MKSVLFPSLCLMAVSVQPLEAGYNELPRGPFDNLRLGRISVSPYEGPPYTRGREMGLELQAETEVDPYKLSSEDPELSFKGEEWFPTPSDSLSPPGWAAKFGLLRSLEPREFRFLIRLRDRADFLFDEHAAKLRIRDAIRADAKAEAERAEKSLWNGFRKRVAKALKKANADKGTKKKVIRLLKEAQLDVSQQMAELRAEIERLQQGVEDDN